MTYNITNSTRVLVFLGSVRISNTTREVVEKANSFQLMPSLQLYLYSAHTFSYAAKSNEKVYIYIYNYIYVVIVH